MSSVCSSQFNDFKLIPWIFSTFRLLDSSNGLGTSNLRVQELGTPHLQASLIWHGQNRRNLVFPQFLTVPLFFFTCIYSCNRVYNARLIRRFCRVKIWIDLDTTCTGLQESAPDWCLKFVSQVVNPFPRVQSTTYPTDYYSNSDLSWTLGQSRLPPWSHQELFHQHAPKKKN